MSKEKTDRNKEIYKMRFEQGKSNSVIARRFLISEARIRIILKREKAKKPNQKENQTTVNSLV